MRVPPIDLSGVEVPRLDSCATDFVDPSSDELKGMIEQDAEAVALEIIIP